MDTTPFVISFPCVYIALQVGHQFADHALQTDIQAVTKGTSGWAGRLACARHVAALTLFQLFLLAGVVWQAGLDLDWLDVVHGMLLNAVSHYTLDRREPLRWLAEQTGKGRFYRLGDALVAPVGTGAYSLDQASHKLILFAAALTIC
jgi:hypothetical protein